MTARLLGRSSRSLEGLLGSCKSRPILSGGLCRSTEHQSGGAPADKTPTDPGGESFSNNSKLDVPAGAWLAPHLVEKIRELANGSVTNTSHAFRKVGCFQAWGGPVGGSLWSVGGQGYATVAEAVGEKVKSVPSSIRGGRLEANGVELVGSLGPVSKRLDITPKQIFAVVQVGSHQFKVTPDDVLYVEKLNGTDIKSTVMLKKVLLLGSKSKTIVGRPFVPDANVLATVEAQIKDAKVLILKKRRRKNSRRLKGHRQELTRLRIMDIRGIEEDQEEGRPPRTHAQVGVVARFKTPEPGKVSAYAFQPKPLPQSRDLKKQRRSPAVPGYGMRLKRRLTFGADRRRSSKAEEQG